MGNIYTLLNSSTPINLLDPLLQSGELRQVNLQGDRSTTNPRETRNIGNGILLTGQVRAFLQPRLENRVETPCFVDIPLNSVIGARIGEETEMVRLSCLVLERSKHMFKVDYLHAPCIGPSPAIWNINHDVCSTCSGVPGA